MNTATSHAPSVRKASTPKRVDITKLSDQELMALDEKTYLASLSPKLRRARIAAGPLRGLFDKELGKCK
jgi:hypothetical protein